MTSFATYFVHDCPQLVKKRQVYLTELTILCSNIQFFCKNKLNLFRLCRKFDFYTYATTSGGGGGLAPIYPNFSISTKPN